MRPRSCHNQAELPRVPVRGLRCLLQLVVGLIQQVFRFLRMTLHVPLVRFLRVDNSLPGLPAQPLRSRQVGVPAGRHVLARPLCDRQPTGN